MKQILIEKGGVERLVTLIGHECSAVRLNAVWALKNLLYNASTIYKKSILNVLTFSQIFRYS
jgi:hypothetical protein